MLIAAIVAAAATLAFLGFAGSHWIAPATLSSVGLPLVYAVFSTKPPLTILIDFAALTLGFYIAFALGKFAGMAKRRRRLSQH